MNIYRFKQENIFLNNENYTMIPLQLLNHDFFMSRPSASVIAKLGGSMKYGGISPYYGFLPAPLSTYKELIKEYNKINNPPSSFTNNQDSVSDS
ncbi:hypothetical protein [Oceanirhabdus sp. W0125-5]|uniref:hypothetical protein n=1 Tax=Oceanirhabdus sp. W0125-5 TaxID=2999116 RepID=UPI0022F32FDB|nr:hypothetical protein [Oceanirhabdus sp. W0125-5]WBW94695.1 hypothetical protein OW730_13420 [Oceanirhabdus sp. W0125-5]